jgi:hypothetical protein
MYRTGDVFKGGYSRPTIEPPLRYLGTCDTADGVEQQMQQLMQME